MPSVPLDFLGDLRRTHNCGELRASDAGKKALLMGWVHRRRDLGGVIFIHLRDREGVTQVVFLADGDKVKVIVRFRGRERAHKDQGYKIVADFLAAVGEHKVEKELNDTGKDMQMILAPIKSKSELIRDRK